LLQVQSDCHFVVFGHSGDWTEYDLIRMAQDLEIADQVTFAGIHLPGERNIAALDLLIATSVREPFDRTLVEAAIIGTPYVATDDAGYREIWKSTTTFAHYCARPWEILKRRGSSASCGTAGPRQRKVDPVFRTERCAL
jgi:hypothetical protein